MSCGPYIAYDLNNKQLYLKINSLLHAKNINFSGIIIDKYQTEYWLLNGKLHREDNPAILYKDNYGEYWLHDERIFFQNNINVQESFKLYVDLLKLKGLL